MNFLKKVQATAKVKRVRKKMREADLKRKRLSSEYKKAVKAESKRLQKKPKTKTNTAKRKKRR